MLDAPAGEPVAALGRFYGAVFGWEVDDVDPRFVRVTPVDGVAYLAVQANDDYVRPVWPAEGGQQQIMLHLDIEVVDLHAAVAAAIELGAVEASHQPQPDVRVMLDPVGHPFCLYASG